MQTPKPHPSLYGLPHDEWRENQYETLQWLHRSDKQVRIIEALTGSGKTSTITAFGHEKRIMSLVYTKLLQQENYGNIYNWDVLFGKGNYECIHPDVEFGTTADQCLYNDVGMNKCPFASQCKYVVKKTKVIQSDKASLNYAYYLLSRWPKEVPYDILSMDEAHMLSDITLDYAGISIHERTRSEWGLPQFPSLSLGESVSLFFNSEPAYKKVEKWLEQCLDSLNATYRNLKLKSSDLESKKELQKCQNMISKVQSTLNSIETNSNQWFIQSGAGLIMYRGKMLPGLIARPLTARNHFKGLFINNPIVTMMSATIGNIDAFTDELGLTTDDYDFISVPSQWHPDVRPIHILDAPRMGYKSTPADYEKQADVISKAILECPRYWEGVIHVSRISEAPLLASRLAKRGLSERVWIPPQSSTNIQLAEWEKHKLRNKGKGSIAIAWSWTEGVDLFDEKICISAKVPFGALGDPFEAQRQKAYPKFYLQRTAWKLVQSLGRTRRGDISHYDIDGQKNGLVAIADANWTRIKKYLSEDILNSIIN